MQDIVICKTKAHPLQCPCLVNYFIHDARALQSADQYTDILNNLCVWKIGLGARVPSRQ